ncbi:MAG: crossover junction endodeoxyribonuclease RuvC [Desulfovibrio sp.]|jgi:crossover junction endodeoxyribonuclease RuvC|nr:crossover junction endodeoxyribonuclease RuvC [Desulfovibrio sp.]
MAVVTAVGIDPGSLRTGWGVVRETSGVLQLVDCGIIRTNPKESFPNRLAHIYREMLAILERLEPEEAAIEEIFTAKNASSALKLGQARGVAIAACAARSMPVRDYEATFIKKSLVGTGSAEKEQVAFMVKRLLNVKSADWALDTSDALAVAICHLTMRRMEAFA